jgi:predicted transcriptional regulator
MKTAKQEVIEIVSELPDESSFEDIQYHIYVRAKLDRAIEAVEQGRVIEHDEVVQRAQKWLQE